VVSFRGRLTLVNAVVLGCVLLAAILLLPSQLSRILKANLDASLLTLAETEVASATDAPGNAVHLHPIAPYGEGADMARLDKIVVLLDRDGRVVGQTSALPDLRFRLPDGFAEEIREGRTTFRTVSSLSGHPIRLVGIPIQGGEPAGMVLVVGTSLQGVENVLQLLDLVLLGVSVIVLAVAGAAGYFLARRALQPVGSLVSQVDQISLQNIGRRLEEPRSEDELAELTRVLNRMLGRLEKGLEIQRRFTSDASHEIRTPLSNLRGEIEVALMRPRSPEQYQETLQSSLEEVNRLTSLVEGLLTLTRMEHDSTRLKTESVNLADLVREEVANRAAEARRRALDLRAEPDGPLNVSGDPTLLARLVANLIDNAIRYCRPKDRIVVSLARNDTGAVIRVEDTGPGITREDRDRVFERFFRGKAVHAAEPRGAGLGLAICKLIVELHGGTIDLRTEEGAGTTVEATVPL
jgi:two-component system OmpR family sensor kinase